MTPERYRQIAELYHAALEVDAEERAALLERACAGEEELRREVESLIASHEQGADFMTTLAIAVEADDTEETDPFPGRTIARYRVLALIRAGGMGRVYLAEDTDLGRRVALKLLPDYFSHDENQVQRFRQEARAASALNHPNIVIVYEVGPVDGTEFIATEYVEGKTLRQHMAGTRMTIGEVLDVAVPVASALQAAHEAGITHRDVKPENIMIRRDGIPKVLDFGLAKLAAAVNEGPVPSTVKTIPGTVMGTTPYMSPEQARGLEVDARTDIWSFGVLLYEMLGARRPFAGATPTDVVAAILKTEPLPIAECAPEAPDELQRIVRKCLEKNRQDRYQTAKDLVDDLRQLQKRLEVTTEVRRSAAPKIPRRPLIAVIALALIAVVALFGYRGWRAADASINSLAVMPFLNPAQDSQTEYLSDGITESLISRLSQLANLKVMSRNSVFRFKGRAVDAQQISQALGVRAVMMGNLKRIGDQLVINVELIDARDGSVIWTRQYIRKMADVIAIQTNVAQDITENLRLKLSGAQQQQLARRYTDNVEAYQLYLKGRYFWNKNRRTTEDFRKSINYYQQAIDLDPNFALAYVGLADCYVLEPVYSDVPPTETYPRGKAAAMKALEIDETLGEAHAALGLVKFVYEWDRIGGEKELQRAIELSPNYAPAYNWYGALLTQMLRFDEGIAKKKVALELDPLSAPIRTSLGRILYYARRYDAAIEECHETLAMDDFYRAHLYIGMAYEQKGMHEQAIAELGKALSLSPGNSEVLSTIAHVYATSGKRDEAQQILNQLHEQSKRTHVDSHDVALIYLGLGQKNQAFEWLEKAFGERSLRLNWLTVEPRLDSIRADPRFEGLVRRAGFPPH